MRNAVRLLSFALISAWAAATGIHGQAPVPPPWAYGYAEAGPEPAPPPCSREMKPQDCARRQTLRPMDVIHKMPGSTRTFTEYQVHFDFGPGDWFPEDHPAMPDIVARGRESDKLRACSLCHYPNGHGRPENGSPAGLPAEYILQQLQAFRDGTRRSADPRKANANEMLQIARFLSETEMKEAAAYFSAIKRRPWIEVKETDTVPKTRPGVNGLFLPLPGNETEPLGKRIIEVPQDPETTERLRNPRSGWLAYVPTGSLARGAELVMKGGGKTLSCTICHGADLNGMGNVPGLADRQASYTVRQLFDIQAGTRESPMMKPVVAKLTEDDMIAIAAYLASK